MPKNRLNLGPVPIQDPLTPDQSPIHQPGSFVPEPADQPALTAGLSALSISLLLRVRSHLQLRQINTALREVHREAAAASRPISHVSLRYWH